MRTVNPHDDGILLWLVAALEKVEKQVSPIVLGSGYIKVAGVSASDLLNPDAFTNFLCASHKICESAYPVYDLTSGSHHPVVSLILIECPGCLADVIRTKSSPASPTDARSMSLAPLRMVLGSLVPRTEPVECNRESAAPKASCAEGRWNERAGVAAKMGRRAVTSILMG